MHREPDMGFDPGSPGSRPGPKAGTKPLCHPGIPVSAVSKSVLRVLPSFTQPAAYTEVPQPPGSLAPLPAGTGKLVFGEGNKEVDPPAERDETSWEKGTREFREATTVGVWLQGYVLLSELTELKASDLFLLCKLCLKLQNKSGGI